MPPASAITKPSRSASNGRLARVGSSLRVESARIAWNAAIPIGTTPASAPPAIMTSASPRLMTSAASPMPLPLVAQADTTLKFGPLRPRSIEIWPGSRSISIWTIRNGVTRSGPLSNRVLNPCPRLPMPPMPEPEMAPNALGVLRGDDQASVLERLARGIHPKLDEAVDPPRLLGVHDLGRIERRDLGGDLDVVVGGVKARDRRDARLAGQHRLPGRIGRSRPRGVTQPMPVTTTRLLTRLLQRQRIRRRRGRPPRGVSSIPVVSADPQGCSCDSRNHRPAYRVEMFACWHPCAHPRSTEGG